MRTISHTRMKNNSLSIILFLVLGSSLIHAFQSQDLSRRRGVKLVQFNREFALEISRSNITDVTVKDDKENPIGSVSAPPRFKKHAHRTKSKKFNKQRRKEMTMEKTNDKKKNHLRFRSRKTAGKNNDCSSNSFPVDTEIELETDEIENENKSYTWLENHPALLLNADYQPMSHLPLSLWTWQDAVKAVFSGKVTVVDVYPNVFIRAANIKMPLPSVIALSEYAPHARGQKPAFTRKNVFLRDKYRCQYCNNEFRTFELTLDHVKPRCLGGRLNWENAVTCCANCNSRKGSLQVHELKSVGMELVREPKAPSSLELAKLAEQIMPKKVHPTWIPFLPFVQHLSAARVEGKSDVATVMNEFEE